MAIGPDPFLTNAAIYLGAAVVGVAIFKRAGLGSILGYLAAGAVIGPSMLGLIAEAEAVLHIAEFGVVLLLFVIGLELQADRLWRMRGEIFGLGLAQVLLTGVALGGGLWVLGFGVEGALVTGLSLALSSTAFGVQIMRERREFGSPYGRRAFSILLFQDLAVVPLLALAAFLAPHGADDPTTFGGVGIGLAAILALLLIGRYGLPWLFRLLAVARADEVFTAAALLVVAAAALVMQSVGLSMALGAFLAGVMLAETEFRHQLETDIEPFRSMFLGLFFIAVGMSVDWRMTIDNWWIVLDGAIILFTIKAVILYWLARWRGSGHRDARRISGTLGQSGEFAFVLLALESSNGLIDGVDAGLLTAVVGVSMAITPVIVKGIDWWEAREDRRREAGGQQPVEPGGPGSVIVAGFGRTGQVVARILRMRGYDLTLIDNSPKRIEIARGFGDRVLFGDGSRLDVLSMAGAREARAIFLCINDREGAQKAVTRLRERFPDTLIMAMTYDRFSLIEMRAAGVDEVVRETFESAVRLAHDGLARMGDNADLDALIEEFRRRDEELIRLQIEHGAHQAVARMREKYEIERRA